MAPPSTRLADPHHFYMDPDRAFHFNADPDRASHFSVDPDPALQSDRNLRPLVCKPLLRRILSLQVAIVSVHCPPQLYFDFYADPYPSFHARNRIQLRKIKCGSVSATLHSTMGSRSNLQWRPLRGSPLLNFPMSWGETIPHNRTAGGGGGGMMPLAVLT